MVEIRVRAHTRKSKGKRAAKKIRRGGSVPGIVYGKGIDPLPIELDSAEAHSLIHGEHASSLESVIVSLEIDDSEQTSPRCTLIKEIQHHPIRGDVIHIDFQQISLTEKVHARIPVITVGDSPGVSEGGILEHTIRELEVACMAKDLPEEAVADISGLGVGESIRVGDLDLGPDVEILNEPELSVVSVTVPRAAVEAVEVAEELAVEPEVIGEEKAKEEEEGEAPKEKKKEE